MSLLTKKFTGALKDGDYKVKIVGIQERTYTNPSTNKSSELVDIHIETLAGQHDTITVGETQLDFIIRDLMNAYYPGKDLSAGEVLNDLKDNESFIPAKPSSPTQLRSFRSSGGSSIFLLTRNMTQDLVLLLLLLTSFASWSGAVGVGFRKIACLFFL